MLCRYTFLHTLLPKNWFSWYTRRIFKHCFPHKGTYTVYSNLHSRRIKNKHFKTSQFQTKEKISRDHILRTYYWLRALRYSVVDIATCYGLDGPEIQSRCRRDFPHLPRPVLGPTSLPYKGYRVISGVNGRGVLLTTHEQLAPRLNKK